MLTLQIISILALACSMFSLYLQKKQQEEIDVHWTLIYYILAFLQSEHEDFGQRVVKMKDINGQEIDLD